jgi:hypothetical protein
MKNQQLYLVLGLTLLLVVFTLQSVAACKHAYSDLDNDYIQRNGDDVIFILRNVDYSDDYSSKFWENENRLPVYEYRNGYSYRASREYQDELDERIYLSNYKNEKSHSDYYDYMTSRYEKRTTYHFQDEPEYYYTYDAYMRSYSKHECYTNPPEGKLFYIKCP